MKNGLTVYSSCRLMLLTIILMPAAFAADTEQEANQNLCEYNSQENTMLDKAYDYLNTKMCEPALWFDNFFVDERISEDARAGTMVRWYNDFKYTEDDGFDYKTRLSARVRIPKATKRLKLVFDNDSDDKLADLFPGSSEDTKNSLGLQYDWFVKGRSSLNFKVSFHPGIQARYRYTYPMSDTTYARFTQKVYQKKKETGSTTSVDLDHRLNENLLIRWNNFVKFSTKFNGSELGTGLTLYQYLSDKRALAYEASLYGKTQPYRFLANQRLAVRYRQNIYRKWLFYEITPAVEWPKEEDESRRDETSVTFRLEVLFNNI